MTRKNNKGRAGGSIEVPGAKLPMVYFFNDAINYIFHRWSTHSARAVHLAATARHRRAVFVGRNGEQKKSVCNNIIFGGFSYSIYSAS